MDEGKGIGSQTHGAGLLPAGFGLARRRTVAQPPQRRAPPHLPHRISLRKRRGRGNAHTTPSQVWRARGRHGACVAHTKAVPLPPLFVSASGTCTRIPALRSPSRACSSGAGVAAPQTPCLPACGESGSRAPRRVRGSVAALRMKIEADSTVYPAMPVVWKAFTWSVAPSTVPPE